MKGEQLLVVSLLLVAVSAQSISFTLDTTKVINSTDPLFRSVTMVFFYSLPFLPSLPFLATFSFLVKIPFLQKLGLALTIRGMACMGKCIHPKCQFTKS
jgi:hypothetical protein